MMIPPCTLKLHCFSSELNSIIKNNDGIDAYCLCKDLSGYNDDDEDEDYDEYDEDILFYKISYRRKLNKKNKSIQQTSKIGK